MTRMDRRGTAITRQGSPHEDQAMGGPGRHRRWLGAEPRRAGRDGRQRRRVPRPSCLTNPTLLGPLSRSSPLPPRRHPTSPATPGLRHRRTPVPPCPVDLHPSSVSVLLRICRRLSTFPIAHRRSRRPPLPADHPTRVSVLPLICRFPAGRRRSRDPLIPPALRRPMLPGGSAKSRSQ